MGKTFQGLAIDPFDANVLAGYTRIRDIKVTNAANYGAYTSTLYFSQDGGENWVARRTPFGFTEVMELRWDARNRGVLYALTNAATNTVWRSSDSGITWAAASNGIGSRPMAYPYALHSDADENLLLLQLGVVLYKSTDRGANWTKQADIPCSFRMEVNVNDPSRIYCAVGVGDQIARSTNQGSSWQTGARIPVSGINYSAVYSARVLSDPQSPDTLIISLFGQGNSLQRDAVYRSTNGGASATVVPGMPGLNRIHPSTDRGLILVTGSGNTFKKTTNFGQSWSDLPVVSGIDTSRNDYIVFAPSNNNLGWMLSPRLHTTDGAQTFASITSQVEVIPVISFTQPISQTLRRGTSYRMQVSLLDSDRQAMTPNAGKPLTNSPWLNWLGGNTFLLSGSTVDVGEYTGTYRLGHPSQQIDVAFKLKVTAAAEPLVKLQTQTVYGNGNSYANEVVSSEGPLPSQGQLATQVPFACCGAIAVGSDGSIYKATRTRILRVAADGIVSSFAGTGAEAPFASADSEKGKLAVEAKFRNIAALVWTTAGLVFSDSSTSQIWRVGADGRLTNLYNGNASGNAFMNIEGSIAVTASNTIYFAGSQGLYRVGAGAKSEQLFLNSTVHPGVGSITGLVAEPSGSLVVTYKTAIYRRDSFGDVYLIAGAPGKIGFLGDGGYAVSRTVMMVAAEAGPGPTTPTTPTNPTPGSIQGESLLHSASSPTLDSQGNIYFIDNYRVRVLTVDWRIDTVVGDGDSDPVLSENSVATSASTGALYGVASNSVGNLFVSTSHRVYRTRGQGVTPTPVPNDGGAVSLAAGSPSVAPGAIFSIYGTNLSGVTGTAPRVPLPTTMGGVQVLVNGKAVPLFYVSALQINAQMPADTAPGQAQVAVLRDGRSSGNISIEVIAAAPDILVYDSNRVVALDESYRLVGPDNPAKPGKYLLVYLTGIGPVDPMVAVGQAASGDALSHATLDSSATLGGQSATISFLGLAPNFVGLAQANIQVPENLPAGNHELVLTVGGKPSNKVMVLVQP